VLSQSSYFSSNDPRLHFGLGAAAMADLEIRWPDGNKQTLKGVAANQILVIKEPHLDPSKSIPSSR
jgi:enediyne biosynthesis protein E4